MDPEQEAAIQDMARAMEAWAGGATVEEFCEAALELVRAMPTIDPLPGRTT